MPDYKTLRGTSTFTYEEKRSRFIATAAFADTEEKALAVLNAVRAANRTARHNVYAYVLQNGRTRYSDDGEPAKTAGTPVLETIGHAGVSDVIVVVTRYFGGILLGAVLAAQGQPQLVPERCRDQPPEPHALGVGGKVRGRGVALQPVGGGAGVAVQVDGQQQVGPGIAGRSGALAGL